MFFFLTIRRLSLRDILNLEQSKAEKSEKKTVYDHTDLEIVPCLSCVISLNTGATNFADPRWLIYPLILYIGTSFLILPPSQWLCDDLKYQTTGSFSLVILFVV
jgi:hypothetical protein